MIYELRIYDTARRSRPSKSASERHEAMEAADRYVRYPEGHQPLDV